MNNETHYYYACSYILAPSSILLPGNWGRIHSLCPVGSNPMLALREYCLESIRTFHYSQFPSRLQCNFVCSSHEGIKNFLSSTDRPIELIYEVELVEPEANKVTLDWSICSQFNEKLKPHEFEQVAHQYWNPSKILHPEVLTMSPLRVVNRIDS